MFTRFVELIITSQNSSKMLIFLGQSVQLNQTAIIKSEYIVFIPLEVQMSIMAEVLLGGPPFSLE